MIRQFSHRANGQNAHAYVVTCRRCGALGKVPVNTAAGTLPPQITAKKLAQQGWVLGSNDNRDTCPTCAGRKPTEDAVNDKVVQIAPPKTAGKEENLIIIDKLKEVYIDEANGYEAGWNDERVAKDLGTPRAWITPIREQFFGPEKSVATQALLTECKQALADAKLALAQIHAIEAKVLSQIEALEKRIERIAA